MDTLFIILFFGFLPALSIGLCFLHDGHSKRRLVLNILLLANAALFLLPPGMAWYINMTEGGAMARMQVVRPSGFISTSCPSRSWWN